MADASPVAHQFDDAGQQHEAATLGMWSFLATELLLFGGLFTAYLVYRILYPAAFAEASGHLYRWLAAANTGVLLGSSYTMALAVHAVETNRRTALRRWLIATMVLGAAFLAIKGVEYWLDAQDGVIPGAGFVSQQFQDAAHAQLFFVIYFAMTGLHATHMTVGLGLLGWLAWRARTVNANTVEMTGLYWHFVDLVWIFLFPLLYLIEGGV